MRVDEGRLGRTLVLTSFLLALACAGTKLPPAPKATPRPASSVPERAPAKEPTLLEKASARFDASDYGAAEALYRSLIDSERGAEHARERAQANLGLAKVLLVTGRYADAAGIARNAKESTSELISAGLVIEAEALRRQGQIEPARALLKQAPGLADDFRLRLSLAEILIEQGNRYDAKQLLMSLIDAHNQGAIADVDAKAMGFVGRAAELLRSPADANDAYMVAERAGKVPDQELLLWRAGMFLEKYDTGHAEEILREILARAPRQPDALVGLARVKLAQTMDFDSAEELARQALAVNPSHAGALFVLASVALRDLELGRAQAQIQRGLDLNPRDLELLSLQATVRFLADDELGFRQLESQVLGYNRQYSHFYDVVGEYADWEHRYDAIVALLREAVRIDDGDVQALAGLGLNLIRIGDDAGGLSALKRAFAKDPFNVRVYNTLNLYEQTIPAEYQSQEQSRFRFRYGKSEAPVLERYVPALIEDAFRRMVKYYGFTPEGPIGIELYEKREHFAVRTSGLPNIGIQGVCFGKTLAVVTPGQDPVNLGMTLWHELSHVFHIQLSKSHVPRWFTEGLAEYETSVERGEWHRERGADLYRALVTGALPAVAQMNRAFSHAETMDDMATAYVASAQIVTMLAEHYGRPKLRKMLLLWGAGKTTIEVLRGALGVSPEALDAEFRSYLRERLKRYEGQFVPLARAGDPDRLREQIHKNPSDLETRLRLAVTLLDAGELEAIVPILATVAERDPSNAEARFLRARLALATHDLDGAEKILKGLIVDGHDGYAIELLLAEIHSANHRDSELEAALLAAHRADPTEADPMYGLLHLAQQKKDSVAELEWLRKLSRIEPHSVETYRRLLELLIEQKNFDEAIEVGESAIYVDLEGARIHLAYAQALAAKGHLERAKWEFESATLCPEAPKVVASAFVEYAKFLLAQGKRSDAKRQLTRALTLDPENAEAAALGF